MATQAPVEPASADAERPQPRWRVRGTVRIVATYLLSMALTATGIVIQANQRGISPLSQGFRPWDSGYYIQVARFGYNILSVTPSGPEGQNPTAFFPGYPLAIRLVVHLFGWAGVGYSAGAWIVNIGSGLAAVLMIAAIVRHYYPEAVAVRSAQAVALFPGAAVLLLGYAEGLFLLLAACCILAVIKQSWWWAGFAALVAG